MSDTLAAVLRADIDWAALPRETPASVRRVLRRCLDRDPKTRFRDIADARIEMDEAAEALAPAAPAAAASSRSRLWPVAALVLLALAALGWWRALASVSAPPVTTRLSLVFPAQDQLPYNDNPAFALSRDGRQLVYVADRAGSTGLSVRALDTGQVRSVEGTANAVGPFFSPDGHWIGFFADGRLKKVTVGGGAPIDLSEAPTPRGGTWLEDDSIVFSPEYTSGLVRIAARGGKIEILTRPDAARSERTHRWPEALPGGADILFAIGFTSSTANYDGATIAVLNLASRKVRPLLEGGSMPRYAPPGRLAFLRGNSVLAAAFDLGRVAVTGEAVPAIQGIGGDLSGGAAYFSTARDGTLAYAPGTSLPQRTLVIVNRKGGEVDVPLSPRLFLAPRFSPDGKSLAFSVGSGNGGDDDVWTYDIAANILTRLTFGNAGLGPVWSPDGKRIAYGSVRGGGQEGIWVKPADGSGRDEVIDRIPGGAEFPTSWSADGSSLSFVRASPRFGAWILPLGAESKSREVQAGASNVCLSPDGRWIAYQISPDGDIFVQPTDGSPGKWQISTNRGAWPVWVGNEIFFLRRTGDIMAVAVETRPSFRAGTPRMLYEGKGRYEVATNLYPFDVSADGQRFVLLKTNARAEMANRIDLVLNWTAELDRLAPVGGKK